MLAMAFALRAGMALAAFAALADSASQCNKDVMEEEMRLAELEGQKYLERKRMEAMSGGSPIKGSSMLQVGSDTRVRKTFTPGGKAVKLVETPSTVKEQLGKTGGKYRFTPPSFNPFMPERMP